MSVGVLIKARPHKYIRRVRTMIGGKLAWRYYYPDDQAMRRGKKVVPKAQHATMVKFDQDQGVLRRRVPLKDLSVGQVISDLAWAKPLRITGVVDPYHKPLVDLPEREDPHGQAMSPLRALEMAFDRLPPKARQLLDGKLREVKFVDSSTKMVAALVQHPEVASVATTQSITVALDRVAPWNSERHLNGGVPLVSTLTRQYGWVAWSHLSSADAASWQEFATTGAGAKEPGITAAAETDPHSRFAESFAAALLYPQQLAETAPETYAWLRSWLGDNALPPLRTDAERRRKIVAEVRVVGRKGNAQRVKELRLEYDRLLGVLDQAEDDPSLTWWRPQETDLQQMLRQAPRPNYNNPEALGGHRPDDRFWEISHGGRTVFVRMPKHVRPGEARNQATRAKPASLLEVWDENGQPLDNETAWWHLFQDDSTFQDGGSEMEGFQGFEVGKITGTAHAKARNRNALFQKIRLASGTLRPVEITEEDFRARSGTMVMDQWSEPGADLVELIKGFAPGTAKYDRLIREYRVAQPAIRFTQVTVTADLVNHGLYSSEQLGTTANKPELNADGSPRLAAKAYRHRMPDGTEIDLRCIPGDPTDPTAAGKWFLESPVWRELLTPHGGDVPSAEALGKLCRQATEAGLGRPPKPRRAWVTMQADPRGGDLDHLYHMQVEWDGRGLPRILGAEWKRRLGVPEPRLNDLVTGTGRNARIVADKIRLESRTRKRGRAALPQPGDQVVLTVRNTERGLDFVAAEKEVVVTLERVRSGDPPRWEFRGVDGGGIPGRSVVRYGAREVAADLIPPKQARQPLPLSSTALVYLHQEVHEVTGEAVQQELRMLLPEDGSLTGAMIENIPGARVVRGPSPVPGIPGAVDHVELSVSGFAQLRQQLGGVSMTKSAEAAINSRAAMLRLLTTQAEQGDHKIPIEDIDPALMAARGVGLVAELPSGEPFELAEHQAAATQKAIDNDGRLLIAHHMGTGKTVTAIVIAKYLMSLRDKAGNRRPGSPQKTLVVAPKNVVEQWRQAAELFDEGALVVGRDKSDIPVDRFVAGSQEGAAYENADFVVVGPEYFTRHQKKLKAAGFDGLIIDEVHKGTKGEHTARVKALEAWNPDMKMLLMLTGTPITTSPADMLPYVRLLSKGEDWGEMARSDFEDEYLEASDVVTAAGVVGRAPRVQIKPSKREELGAVLARWTHVALSKDVKGKTLPAVRINESQFAEMRGVQLGLYGLHMAALSPAERAQFQANSALAADELRGLGRGARRHLLAAKAVANCPAYKAASTDEFLMVGDRAFTTFGTSKISAMDWLMKRPDVRTSRKRWKLRAQWPPVEDLTEQEQVIYATQFREILGAQRDGTVRDVTYAEIAGTGITPPQLAAMRRAGWDAVGGAKIDNPEWGPVGIQFRGINTPRKLTEAEQAWRDQAILFQSAYATALEAPVPPESGGRATVPDQPTAFARTVEEFGVSLDEAERFMNAHPDAMDWQATFTHGGVTVTTKDRWVSDKTGSAHVPFRWEDWDIASNRPKSSGGFETVLDSGTVSVGGRYAFLKPPKPPKPPEDLQLTEKVDIRAWQEQWSADWAPGPFRYEARHGESEDGKQVVVRDLSSGELHWVRKADVSGQVRSIFDVGMRAERAKFDLAMVAGNVKMQTFMDHLTQFSQHTDGDGFAHGSERSRAWVYFAGSILSGCRPAESALRVMGYRDVNEMIEGSPHYDPDDVGPAPNGKYFVTYIGATHTGDRELNLDISRKKKDRLDRDTNTSLFVDKVMAGRKWKVAGGRPHPHVKMAQYTYEQRERIQQQFGITPPEAFFHNPKTDRVEYFYGSDEVITFEGIQVPKLQVVREPVTVIKNGKQRPGPIKKDPVSGLSMMRPAMRGGKPVTEPLVCKGSAEILHQMVLVGDPNKMSVRAAREARRQLDLLQTEYVKMVQRTKPKEDERGRPVSGLTNQVPLTLQQIAVFNNCEGMILSDAAQVGINKGDAVEMIMGDSLASPMAEMQRITRSARMLPPSVPREMLDKYIARVKGFRGEVFKFAKLSADPAHPAYVAGAEKTTVQGVPAWQRDGKILVTYRDANRDKVTIAVALSDLTLADGPFKRIRDHMEVGAFDPGRVASGPQGSVANLRIGGAIPETLTFSESLDRVALFCEENSERARARDRRTWMALAARARVARNMGTMQAKAALEEFRGTRMPGKAKNLIGYSKLDWTDPTKGTYALHTAAERARDVSGELRAQSTIPDRYHVKLQEEINEPVNAIADLLENELTVQERHLIAEAGFTRQEEAGSLDPTAIYLAIRGSEIMDHVTRRIPEVAGDMRRAAGGRVVTDEDVMTRIIDELSPMDRAIIKAKKYQVNVTRLGVSGYVPRMTTTRDADGNEVQVFTGYDRQHPVDVERNVRAIGRARKRPVEALNHEIQRGVKIRTSLDHHVVDHRAILDMSRQPTITKSFMLENLDG